MGTKMMLDITMETVNYSRFSFIRPKEFFLVPPGSCRRRFFLAVFNFIRLKTAFFSSFLEGDRGFWQNIEEYKYPEGSS